MAFGLRILASIHMNAFKTLQHHAIKWRDFIIDLIFPIECLSCGREGRWLCGVCSHKLRMNESQACIFCGNDSRLGKTCRKCRKSHHIDGVWVAGRYSDELTQRLIKNLKYFFLVDLGPDLGRFLARFLERLAIENALNREQKPLEILADHKQALIIPVPLHEKRERARGFNQSALIASGLAAGLGLEMEVTGLARIRQSRPQAKLPKEMRRENVKGCFEWQGADLSGKNVIIIDDVATTGATLDEAAAALKTRGAKTVFGLVVARG